MVYNVTADEIRAWPVDVDGFHVDPKTGTHIKIGDGAKVGEQRSFGVRAEGAEVGARAQDDLLGVEDLAGRGGGASATVRIGAFPRPAAKGSRLTGVRTVH